MIKMVLMVYDKDVKKMDFSIKDVRTSRLPISLL